MKQLDHQLPNELLRTDSLAIGYRTGSTQNTLLENLNLIVRKGELICFMGPNGIGKSTLIRTLAGLQSSISGRVFTHQQDLKPGIEKSISLVLTDRITAVNMTVQELVTYGRYPYLDWNLKLTAEDNNIIQQAIAQTHIENLAQKKLYELSDGQMQMAMIARALAQDTPVLLLDEPTAHLDLNNRVEIMNLLRNLAHHSGKGILVATHELDLALQTADTIWLTGKNKNILTGIPEDLVLNGSFDDIFQFKGFDLKTGKVFHEAWRGISIALIGEGYEYLWTKNALERNGFLTDMKANFVVQVSHEGNPLTWEFQGQVYHSLQQLLVALSS
ncbi:MAG: ABC transporter ATP-binding protein [Cyclobacteriaceae bacterium]|nr:ABC transporter ATP-binding protein [Cyclobacteriaceae bacterium]